MRPFERILLNECEKEKEKTAYSIENNLICIPDVNKNLRPYGVLSSSSAIRELNDICYEIADRKDIKGLDRDYYVNDRLIPTLLCNSMSKIFDVNSEEAKKLYNRGPYGSI